MTQIRVESHYWEVSAFAKKLVEVANLMSSKAEGEFNGTPIYAYEGESWKAVTDRWNRERKQMGYAI